MIERQPNWVILEAENGSERAIYRLRTDQPEHVAQLHTLVTVEWQYTQQDEAGFPVAELRAAMDSFEEAIVPLTSGTGSELVLVITGMGLKEWAFYTTGFEAFMETFNQLMANVPRVPIKLSYSEDPDWEYWLKYRQHAN